MIITGPAPDKEARQRFINYLAAEHKKGTQAQQRKREIEAAHASALENQDELKKLADKRRHPGLKGSEKLKP